MTSNFYNDFHKKDIAKSAFISTINICVIFDIQKIIILYFKK